jgi:dTDP-4-amino-4,6-dideoxygalactose transaminase
MKNRDEVEILGYNSRLDTLQAIVGNWLIRQTQDITNRRIANAAAYDKGLRELEGDITLPPRRADVRRVYHLYMVYARRRDELYKHLHENGVDAKIHYPIPLYQQNAFKFLGHKPGDFPESDRQAASIITFPADQHLEPDQVQYVIETVKRFYRK